MIQKLSVIIPCYNEEGNISRIKNELIEPLKSLPFEREFIFVDDGSEDKTGEKIKEVQQENPYVKLVEHSQNKGLGQSIRSALPEVSGDAILTLDADLTFHPNDIPKLIDLYDDSVDCVIGSPILGQFENVNFFRKFLSQSVNLIYRILLNQKITSVSALFRLYRAKVIKELNLKSQSFDINAEIVMKLIFSGHKVVETPVTLGTRQWGESKIQFSREIYNHLANFLKILRLRWGKG